MPRVPVVEGPSIRTAALLTPTQRTPDVSSGLENIGRAVGAAAEVVDRRLQQQVEIEANTADAEITAGWLQWDAEARRKYQGGNIDQYETEAAGWWDKARETYGQRLSPAARQQLGVALQRRMASALGSVAQHAGAVRERHATETYDAAQNARLEFGVDTGNVAGVRNEIMVEAAKFGALRGWAPEQVQEEQQKRVAALHLVHITRLAEGNDKVPGDPAAAQAYYERHKAEIPASTQARLEQVLAGEKLNQEAKAKAAELAPLPLAEQLQRAGALAPALRERVLIEVRNNNALVRQAEAERIKAIADQAWEIAGTGRLPPERMLGQLGREGVAIRDYLRNRAEEAARKAEGKPTRTDPKVLAELLDLATADPERFKSTRIQTLVGKLDEQDMLRVAALQRDMLQPEREREVATTIQHVVRYTGGMKPERKAEFEREALNAFEEHRAAKGKAPTFEERRVILDRLAFSNDGFFSKSQFFQIAPTDRPAWVRKTVPADDRKQIEAVLQRRGVPVTPENILDLYIAGQRR